MPRLFRFADRSQQAPAGFLARLFLSITLCAALGAFAPSAAPAASAQVNAAPAVPAVNPDGSLNLRSGTSGALDLHGWNVTLDSQRGPILARQGGAAPASTDIAAAVGASQPPAALSDIPQPSSFWLPLPHSGFAANGSDGVNAIAVSGNDIYVGGHFTQTTDGTLKDLGNIAKFNTNTNTWSALPHKGLNYPVYALAIMGSSLYVGGAFTQSGDGVVTDLNKIAQFSGGAWLALPKKGLDTNFQAYVYALAVSGNTLYVGGHFNGTADLATEIISCNVIKFSGGAWSAAPNLGLGNNCFGWVYALAVSGSDLYVGGLFGQTGDNTVPDLNDIARLSAGVWSPLPNKGLNNEVHSFAVTASGIYVGGLFGQTFDGAVTNLSRIARLSGGVWSALPDNGLSGANGLSGSVYAFAVNGSSLYVGGSFNQTAGGAAKLYEIARFNTISNTWSALPNKGLNGGVGALAFRGNDLFVGGGFARSADDSVRNLNNIAKLTNDTDGDGIPDDWEIHGVTINGQFVDLPGMGANPLHKDLFVHADWMDGPGLKPDARDLQVVSDAFDHSPLTNPDGTTGVHLHVDLGPDSVMNPVTGATWGTLAVAQALPYQATLGSTAGNVYNWTAFDALKQLDFNGSQRAAVFHYMCFCSTIGGLGTTSGLSRGAPAHDFMVTLGGWRVVGGTSLQKAGTFMHELGHNLGLEHGGADDINFKPNYLSVMNYSFQTLGLLTPSGGHILRSFDYSERQLPTLNETFADESAGIADPDGHFTFWNKRQPNAACQTHPTDYFSHLTYPATDWNCDGVSTPITFTVAVDINGDGVCVGPGLDNVGDTAPSGDDVAILGGSITAGPNRKCETTATGDDVQLQPVNFQQPNLLTSFNDWSAVVFDAGNQIGQPPAALAGPSLLAPSDVLTTTVDEPTFKQISDAVPPVLFDAETSAPIDVVSYAPASGPAALVVHFDGGASTTPTGTVNSWVWDFGDSTVGSGASITHTYALPGTYFATLRVTNSHGDVNLVALQHRVTVSEVAKLFLPLTRR